MSDTEIPRVPARVVTQLAVSAAAAWSQLPSLPTAVNILPADNVTVPVA
jgi:hypothetical protein